MTRNSSLRFLRCAFFIGICAAESRAIPPYGPFLETQTITLSSPMPFEDLGYSLDAADGLLIAGAINSENATGQDVGSAYVYRRAVDGSWNPVTQLMSSDGVHNDAFGHSVAIDGDNAIVTALYHKNTLSGTGAAVGTGAAYIFHRTNESDWQQVGEFLAPRNVKNYGSSLSISGSQAAVSGSRVISLNSRQGFFDILERSGPSSWVQVQRIEWLGQRTGVNAVAIGDGTLMVGGYQQAISTSPILYPVEVYRDSPTGFVLSQTLQPNSNPSVVFGSSIALDHDRVLIGAAGESNYHGAAYIFERDANDIWVQTARLEPSDIGEREGFGTEVALQGNLALISSPDAFGPAMDGAVYVFQQNAIGQWVETAKLRSMNDLGHFGFAIATLNGQVFASSGLNSPGAVHVFSEVPEPGTFSLVAVFAFCLWRVSPYQCLRDNARRGIKSVRNRMALELS